MGQSRTHRRIYDNLVGLNGLTHADGNSLVVVALPAEDDPVQKISSEKAAHMTLLYLGKPEIDQTQIDLIAEFVEHAASQISQFYLDVESRGVLGDENADVLFFDKRWAKDIAAFRTRLLQNDLIAQAYLSTEQFPEWTPHLTLGYPATPAKKAPEGYPRYSSVAFDRISLWTGDSVGPTFQLKRQVYDDMEVAMSQIERGRSFLTGEVTHYGVKGMHWGVRRGDSGGKGSAPAAKPAPKPRMSEDAKNVEKAFGKIDRGGTDSLSNHELQSVVNRLNLEQQYSRLVSTPGGSKQTNEIERGHAAVKQMLGVGKTINDVHKFMKSPAGKALKKGFKAAKFGVKVYTNPGGAALDLVRPKNHFTNVG
jgi:2'-5' RNA ligase